MHRLLLSWPPYQPIGPGNNLMYYLHEDQKLTLVPKYVLKQIL
jgi:hypothetical protein